MYLCKTRLLFISIFLLCPLTFLFAQSKLDSIQELQSVEISIKRIPTEIIPVQTLSGEMLARLSAHSAADAIRYFAGVQLKDYGGIGGLKTVNIRSMGSQHVGVFYDGIQIDNAQNGVVDLGKFSLDNMEAISLYNGQKSAIFQPAKHFTTASAIYFTSKTPNFKENKNYNIKSTFKTGSFGYINPSVFWEQKLSNNVSSSLSAEYMYTTGKYNFTYKEKDRDNTTIRFDTTAVRKNGDVNMYRIEHSLIGKMDGGEWKTRAYFYNSRRGIPGAVVKEEPGRFVHADRQTDKNFFFQSSIKKKLTEKYVTTLSGKYAYDYIYYASDTIGPVRVKNKYMLHEAYISSANMINILPFWSINISADFQWNKLNATLQEFVYPRRYSTWVVAATSLDFDRLKIQANILGTFVDEEMKVEKQVTKHWKRYTPTLVASWQPWKEQSFNVRAFYKRIFRMPTFSEIYYAIIGSGTSNLRPENATQYNLGVTYGKDINSPTINYLEAQVDAYYNEITDKILAKPAGRQFRWTMMNIGYVKIRGVDATIIANSKLAKDWTLNTRFSYTYQKAQDYSKVKNEIDKNLKYKKQIAYIPWHSGSAIANLSYKSWGLNYSFIYTGIRYTESANIPENKILAWYTHDMSVNKALKWNKTDIRLTGEINNIFNQQYEVVSRYPMPGTNFKFIVNITI